MQVLRRGACKVPHHFRVKMSLHVVGPVRLRTKHKEHELFYAEGYITLPFVPYPGLGVTMEAPRRCRLEHNLYLRIRSVEWVMPAEEFHCTADEVLNDPTFDERLEIRGCHNTEERYLQLQKVLQGLGFDLMVGVSETNKITKFADGTWQDSEEKAEFERRYIELLHWARERKTQEPKAKSPTPSRQGRAKPQSDLRPTSEFSHRVSP